MKMGDALLEHIALLLKNGNKDEARKLLVEAVNENPSNSAAWYGLSFCLDDIQQKKDCLHNALAINPGYTSASERLSKINAVGPASHSPGQGTTQVQAAAGDSSLPTPSAIPATVTKKPTLPNRNKAGQSTYRMAKKRRSTAWIIGLIGLLVVAVVGFIVLPNAKILGIGGGGILLILILLLTAPDIIDRMMGKKIKEAKRVTRGARAEEKIGGLLEKLGDNYFVLHDVECAYGNIDHLVIGKTGNIFMIETKSHGGKVTIENDTLFLNGHHPEKDFIAQSLRNSFWLRDRLEPVIGTKPWITPILVFTNAFVPYTKPIKGIHVINKKFLLDTIRKEAKSNSGKSFIWDKKDEIIMQLV